MEDLPVPTVPVSWGELLDKITILDIKRERIGCAEARANVVREHHLLCRAAEPALQLPEILPALRQLKAVNEALWEIEDAIRGKEAALDFGPEFVALARSVYKENDRRAALKREINFILKSGLVEEKSYAAARSLFFGASSREPTAQNA